MNATTESLHMPTETAPAKAKAPRAERQNTPAEQALIVEARQIAQRCGDFIEKLRALPATPLPELDTENDGTTPFVDQRWVSIGATQLQLGFMAVIRGISQPTTF